MNKNKLDQFKKALQKERNELTEDLAHSNESFSNLEPNKTGDLADQAYNFSEKELLIGLSTGEKETLKAIKHALEKIENNRFGTCETCHNLIEDKRLEAIPYANLCVECKKNGSR